MTAARARLAALLVLATGFSPFQREQPDVREGNEALTGGDPAAALRRYDAAERAAGARPEIDYDRGNALFRLGRDAEARDAWRRALDRGAGALSTRALQNVGNALARAGDRDGAIRAYTDALRADPSNDDARYDLEVLLRQRDRPSGGDTPPPAGDGGDGRKRDAQRSQQGGEPPRPDPQQGKDPQAKDARPEQGGQQPSPARPEASQQGKPEPRPGERREPEARPGPDGKPGERGPAEGEARAGERPEGTPAPLSRQDAERLLDALRARERNMPVSPSGSRRDGRRADAAKDW